MMDTSCKKCKSPMPTGPAIRKGPLAGAKFTLTGYACQSCGHWNSLKQRKGWKEYKEASE